MEINKEHIALSEAKMEEKKVLDIVHADLSAATEGKTTFEKMIEKSLDLIEGVNVLPVEEGRSQIIVKDALKQTRWALSQMLLPFKTEIKPISVVPTYKEVSEKAKLAEELLNYQVKKKLKWTTTIRKFLKQFIDEGAAIGKVVWKTRTKDVVRDEFTIAEEDYDATVMEIEEAGDFILEEKRSDGMIDIKTGYVNIIDERFDIEQIPFENFYPDPDATVISPDENDCDFVIEKREMTLSQALEEGEEKGWKNLDKLKEVFEFHKKHYNNSSAYSANNTSSTFTGKTINELGFSESTLKSYRDTMLPGKDASHKKGGGRDRIAIFVEYGYLDLKGDGKLVRCEIVFSGDILLYCEQSDYPDDSLPYIFCAFDKGNNSIYGTPFYKYIQDGMEVRSALMRGYLDNVAYANYGRWLVKKGALDAEQYQALMEGRIGDVTEINGNPFQDIKELGSQQLPSMHYNLYEMWASEQEHSSGYQRLGQGQGSTNTASQMSMSIQAGQQRINDNIDDFSENFLKKGIELGHKMNVENLSEQRFRSVVGEDSFIVTGEQLDVDVDIEIVFNMTGQNDVRVQQIIQIMSQSQALVQSNIISPAVLKAMFKKLLNAFNFKDIEFMIDMIDDTMPNGKQSLFDLIKANAPGISDDEAAKMAEDLAQEALAEIEEALKVANANQALVSKQEEEKKAQDKKVNDYNQEQASRRKAEAGEEYTPAVNISPVEISQKRTQQEVVGGEL